MLSKSKIFLLGLFALGGSASLAHGGFILSSWDATPDAPTGTWSPFSWWGFHPDAGDPSSSSSLGVTAGVGLDDPSAAFNVTGLIDSDPTLDVVQKVTNDTNAPWTTLRVGVVQADGETIANLTGVTPGAGGLTTPFTTATTLGANTVIFSGGTVQPGGYALVEVTFDIGLVSYNDPSGNSFAYTITAAPNQTSPIPEPVSAASLAGLGSLTVLKRRRPASSAR